MQELQSLTDRYAKSVYEKDLEGLLSIYDDKIMAFDMWQVWTYDGMKSWREMNTHWFEMVGKDRDVITFEDLRIEQTDELASITAIVRYAAVNEKGEELRHMYNRLTWVARKFGEDWKVIHQHTSSPIDFSTMKVMLTREGVVIRDELSIDENRLIRDAVFIQVIEVRLSRNVNCQS